jgi:hypothetical protein
MPSRAQSLTLTYTAIDVSTNKPKLGDTANHTLYWTHDGTTALATNAPAGITAPADVGQSNIVLTSGECTANFGSLSGSSTTANVVIIPLPISFEQLPTAAPASANGLLTCGIGACQIAPTAGGVDVQTIKTQTVTCAAGVTVLASVGTATVSAPQLNSDPLAVILPGSYGEGTAGLALSTVFDGVTESQILYPQADVSAATLATSFTLAFENAVTAANLVGWGVDLGIQIASPSFQIIATAVQVDSTHITVTFATGFSVTPTVGFMAVLTPPSSLLTDSSGRVTLSPLGLDAVQVETGVNARQALSPILAACAGVASGLGSGTVTFKAGNAPATTRIVATTDTAGDRTAVTLTLPA